MKYYAYLVQAGEGCDYTIGCGKKLVYLCDKKTDIQESLEKVLIDHGSDYASETRMRSVKILAVDSELNYDINGFYQKQREESEKIRREAAKEAELAQLAALKAKYPDA